VGAPSVCVVGAAATPVGRYAGAAVRNSWISEPELLTRVAVEALADAGVTAADVQSAVFTQALPSALQQGFATHMAARLGLRCRGQLAEVLQMGISGGLAFDLAANDIVLGRASVALAAGVAFHSGVDQNEAMLQRVRVTGDSEFQAPFGAIPIAWYALDAARYLYETVAKREHLAHVAVKSRAFARDNPLAQFRGRLTLEEVLGARPIVEPLGQHDVPAIGDGAICLVLASDAVARRLARPAITLRSRSFRHDGYHQFGPHPHDITAYPAVRDAAHEAIRAAGVNLEDVDVAEIYAPCTISEVLATEAIGWFPRGAGAPAAASGETSLGGRIPINTSGGCLSRGHPPALTGLYGILEIREQLLHRAGARQIPNAQLGLTTCEGGNYNTVVAHLFEGPG
jgi:acetyl-CoA C-acetyltransferase